MWGRGQRGNNVTCISLCPLSVTSSAIHKQIGPFWCWFPGGWISVFSRTWGSLQWTLLWGWEFLSPPHPSQVFSVRDFKALFPHTGTLGSMICLAPQWFLPVYLHTNVGPLALPAAVWLGPPAATLPASVLQLTPCCESFLPLLLVWMSVSSLIPWLLDFHTIWFSVSSDCFLFLYLLFFWLCEEAQCVYLCLHVGQKSSRIIFISGTFD